MCPLSPTGGAIRWKCRTLSHITPRSCQKLGLNVCINSDDPEQARRLNLLAAKTVKYGGVSEEEALKMVTLNPAKALHVADRVGGKVRSRKDADLVLWSDHPLSVYARAEQTIVDGIVYYSIERDAALRRYMSRRNEKAGTKDDRGKEERRTRQTGDERLTIPSLSCDDDGD